MRLRWADVADTTMTIFDGKGRPGQGPRPHQIPLLAVEANWLAMLKHPGEFAISTTVGNKPISVRTMAEGASAIVGDSVRGFQHKRIRSGVETMLAATAWGRDVRGYRQSHGLTGVQQGTTMDTTTCR